MKAEYVYCAVDEGNDIKTVQGSSRNTRYFRTTKFLKRAVARHNLFYEKDQWRIAKFELVEVPESVHPTGGSQEPEYEVPEDDA